jgi:PAS domain S-box-containing protein
VIISEEMYRSIVEAVPSGIWVVDPEGRTIFSNRRMAEHLGLDFESMPGQSCFAAVYPEDMADAQRHFARALGGDSRPFDFRLRRADGSPIWVSISCMPVHDENGMIGLLGLFSDITEQKQTDAALRESEERFRNMADSAPVMIWVTGPDKLFTFVNKTWLEFTGRSMEQELGDGWASGVHPEDLQYCYETFVAAFDARRSFSIEVRLRRADGEYRSMLCCGAPRFTPDGSFAGYIGSDIDITDLQSEKRFRQLAENIDEIFWMLDIATNKVLYVSPAFEKIWGQSSAGVYQNRDWLIESVHVEDRDRFVAFFEKIRSEPVEESYRIVHPDGSVRWIHDRAFLIRDSENRPYRVAGIAEDITAHRELEEQLRQAHKLEAVGRLAGGIAHDFNNILTGILGYSALLLNAPGARGTIREAAEAILHSGQRAASLTAQLLAFSRKQRLEPKVLDLNLIVADMKRMLMRVIGEHIDLITTLQPGLGRVEADPHQMEEVIMNLAVNARDAMPNGGKLIIETRDAWVDQNHTERQPAISPGFYVVLSVSDTGMGMDPETQRRVFEPFFTTKEVGKGTGLGLAMVYGTVEQSKGHILVDSRPGCGATFRIYLPRTSRPERRDEVSHEVPRAVGGNETILLAEDEPMVRDLVGTVLQQCGYRVLDPRDCWAALEAVERYSGKIDLLISDLVMPGMNGFQLAEKVVALRPQIKVLYMSGYSEEAIESHTAGVEAVNVIRKPFTPDFLARRVRQALDVQ